MLFWKKKPASVDVCGFFIDNFLAAHILYQADCNMGDEEITGDIPKRIAGGLFDQYAREGRFAALHNPYTPYPYIPEALDGFPELGVRFIHGFTGTIKSLFGPRYGEPVDLTCDHETIVYMPVTKPEQGLDPETQDYMARAIQNKFAGLRIYLPEHYDWTTHFVHISGISKP